MNDFQKGIVAGIWLSWVLMWAAWIYRGGSYPGPSHWMGAEGAVFGLGLILPAGWLMIEYVGNKITQKD